MRRILIDVVLILVLSFLGAIVLTKHETEKISVEMDQQFNTFIKSIAKVMWRIDKLDYSIGYLKASKITMDFKGITAALSKIENLYLANYREESDMPKQMVTVTMAVDLKRLNMAKRQIRNLGMRMADDTPKPTSDDVEAVIFVSGFIDNYEEQVAGTGQANDNVPDEDYGRGGAETPEG